MPTLQSPPLPAAASGWRSTTIDPEPTWHWQLSSAGVAALRKATQDAARQDLPLAEVQAPDELRQTLSSDLEGLRSVLRDGRGFVIQRGLELANFSVEEAKLLYWLLGQCLGQPLAQNVQGTLLYDVRDTGRTVEGGARFSATNADSSFHTDASFAETQVDYVGLLCLRTALQGGVNQLVDGRAVLEELEAHHPEVLEVLAQRFHVDRRGGSREGEAPTVLYPILERQGEEPIFRYLRYWIEAGHEKAGEPLIREQREALDLLDHILRRPELRVEFSLKPGELLWVNNHWIFHSRTAFEDHPEPERRRHLIRLWLAHDPQSRSNSSAKTSAANS